MHPIPEHLVAEISVGAFATALADWKCLLGDTVRPLLAAASGDVFLVDAKGEVIWLETGAGSHKCIAASVDEFYFAAQDPENRAEWFFEPVINRLRAAGVRLTPGQCYGYRTLPALGGAYEGDNRVPIDAAEHIGFTGYVHGQIKDLPDGAEIVLKWVDRVSESSPTPPPPKKSGWWSRLTGR